MMENEIKQWIEDHALIFPPSNKRPTPEESAKVFEIANILNPKGNHKPTSCGRCFYNARNVLIAFKKTM